MQALLPPPLYTSPNGELPPVPRSSQSAAAEGRDTQVESVKDYIGKDDFLRVLAASVLPFSKEEHYAVVASVIQFNLKDGIELASRVGFSPTEMVGLLAFSQHVRTLHQDFHTSFRAELKRVSSDLTSPSKEVIRQAKDPLRNALSSGSTEAALELITKHYEELWADKVFVTPSQSTQDPKLVGFLKEMVRACEPHYYTGPIKEKIKGILGVGTTEAIREDLKRIKSPCDDFLAASAIPQATVNRLARIYGFDAESVTTEENRSLPLRGVYTAQRTLLQEKLTAQLVDSLVHRLGVERENITFSEKWDPCIDGKRVPSREGKPKGREQAFDQFERVSIELPEGVEKVKLAVSPDNGRVLVSYRLDGKWYLTDGRGPVVHVQGVEEISVHRAGKGFAVLMSNSHDRFGVLPIESVDHTSRYGEMTLGRQLQSRSSVDDDRREEGDGDGQQFNGLRCIEKQQLTYADSYEEIAGKLAYRAERQGRFFTVHDGNEGANYDHVEKPIDVGGRRVHSATKGNKSCIVSDGLEGNWYDQVGVPVGINGKPAHKAKTGHKWCIVHDGVEGCWYDDIGDPIGIDGKETYRAKKGDKWCIVHGGEEERLYDGVGDPIEIDGKRAYQAKKGDKWCIVHGEVEGKWHDEVGRPIEINRKPAYKAKTGDKCYIVHDEVDGRWYDDIGDPVKINGKPAYSARKGDKQCIAKAGVKGRWYDWVFDPIEIDGKDAYLAKKGGKWLIVIEDKEGPLFPLIERAERVGRGFVYTVLTTIAGGESVWALYNADHTLEDYIVPKSLRLTTNSAAYLVEENNRQVIRQLKVKTSSPPTLTDEDRKLITLLRLISGQYTTASTLKRISTIINPEPKNDFSIVGSLMAGLKKLGVVRHKGVHGVSPSRLVENLFPELREAKERKLREQERALASRSLGDTGNYQVGSGNPLVQGDTKQQVHTEYKGALVNALYGEFDPLSNQWKPYATSVELLGEPQEHEVTVTGAQGTSGRLLAPFNSAVDPKSIEGAHVIDAISSVPTVQVTSTSLRYTACVGNRVNVGSNPDWDTYSKVMSSSVDTRKLLVDLAPDNKELSQLAASLRRDTPLATAAAIQSYVRGAMHYDHAAVEVNSARDKLAPAERITAMEGRLKALLSEGATGIGVKRYAGVCTDAGILTTTLLRKAGLAAGLAATSDPTRAEGHLCSFVSMPAVNKPTTIIVQVDGTPSSGNSVTDGVRGFDLSEYLEEASQGESNKLTPAALDLTEVLNELLSRASSLDGRGEMSEELRRQLDFLFSVRVSATSKAVALDLLGELFWARSDKSDLSVSEEQRLMLKGGASRKHSSGRSVERELDELMANGTRAGQAREFYRNLKNDSEFSSFDGGVMNALRILIEKASV